MTTLKNPKTKIALTKSKNSSTMTKILAIKCTPELHKHFKSLARYEGISIQDAGVQAFEDWIEWMIENKLKPELKDIKEKQTIASMFIKG
jgi:hypothetical protein